MFLLTVLLRLELESVSCSYAQTVKRLAAAHNRATQGLTTVMLGH
jgi:hypothetical protein